MTGIVLMLGAALCFGFVLGAPVWTYLALRRAAEEYDDRLRLAARYRDGEAT